MATTTNYGWTTPDDTGLVKDGASNIRTLGSSVDTTLFNITAGKNMAYVPLNTTSFTSSTSVIISNVFSSTYDNYEVLIDYIAAGNASGKFLLRNAGGDLSTAFYQTQRFDALGASISGFRDTNGTSGQFPDYGQNRSAIQVKFYAPNLPRVTQWQANGSYNSTNTAPAINLAYGFYNENTQATGFRLSSTAALTGTLTVYGLRSA